MLSETTTDVYTQAEMEAAWVAIQVGVVSINDDNLRAGAEYVLGLADRIRNERAVAAMQK